MDVAVNNANNAAYIKSDLYNAVITFVINTRELNTNKGTDFCFLCLFLCFFRFIFGFLIGGEAVIDIDKICDYFASLNFYEYANQS